MKKTITIIKCDSCDEDISPIDTMYPHEYILRLEAYDIAYNTSGAIYPVFTHKPLENDLFFCNKKCLKDWANKVEDLK